MREKIVKIAFVLLHWMFLLVVCVTSPIFSWLYGKQKNKLSGPQEILSASQADILLTTATELAAKIRLRKVICVFIVSQRNWVVVFSMFVHYS